MGDVVAMDVGVEVGVTLAVAVGVPVAGTVTLPAVGACAAAGVEIETVTTIRRIVRTTQYRRGIISSGVRLGRSHLRHPFNAVVRAIMVRRVGAMVNGDFAELRVVGSMDG